MNELGVRLSLLVDITIKKKDLLEIILNITFNQNCIVTNELDQDSRKLFLDLSVEKQKVIDEIYNLDTVFQRTYDTIKNSLNPSISEEDKQKIKSLQEIINSIVVVDSKICELESTNSSLLEHKKSIIEKNIIKNPKVLKSNMNKAIEQYNIQNNNYSKHKIYGGNQWQILSLLNLEAQQQL